MCRGVNLTPALETQLPVRKPQRLRSFDYSSTGLYFITICSLNMQKLFSVVPVNASVDTVPQLTKEGEAVARAINNISERYQSASVDAYVIMPNHVHIIIDIDNCGRQVDAPTVSRIVSFMKRAVSMELGFSPWQKSFYDRVIRDDKEYFAIAQYIINNPGKWAEDRYYL